MDDFTGLGGACLTIVVLRYNTFPEPKSGDYIYTRAWNQDVGLGSEIFLEASYCQFLQFFGRSFFRRFSDDFLQDRSALISIHSLTWTFTG